MHSGQLTVLIKGLISKHLESLEHAEAKLKNSRKSEIFKLRRADQLESNDNCGDYIFTFDEWHYNHNNHKWDEPIIIGGFMGNNYVNNIYVDSRSSTNVMYKHFYKELQGYVHKKVEPLDQLRRP